VKVLALVVATLVAFAMAEGAGQIVFRMHTSHWLSEDGAFTTNTVVPYTIRVGDRREYSLRPNYSDPVHHLTIDERGFRVTTPAPEAADRLVVNLGDSVPFGAGCCTDDDTYSSYLAQDFRRRGVRLGVVNGGVPSYNIRQSFDRFSVDILPRYDWPRVAAVTLVAGNDASLVAFFGSKYSIEQTWARGRNFIAFRPSWQRFAVAYYFANVRDRIVASRARDDVPAGMRPEDAMLAAVATTLRRELAKFRERHVPVILPAVNPYFYQLKHQERNAKLTTLNVKYGGTLPAQEREWSRLIDLLNDVIRTVSLEFDNTMFLDTRLAFDEAGREGLFADYIHFTPSGSRLMATLIEAQLDASGRLVSREAAAR
jgi:hypothetical protein